MAISKKSLLSLLIVCGMLLLGAASGAILQAAGKTDAAFAEENESDRRTVSVTGTGEVKVAPDVAYVTLGVQSRAEKADQAQQANARTFAAVEKALRETFKVQDKDIQTVGYYVQPEYRYNEKGEPPAISGYTATHMVRVTFRDLGRLGELLDAASKAGANRIDYIQFGTEKTEQYEIEAMKKAMANARKKAEALAAAENKTIKDVVHISQSESSARPVYADSAGFAREMAADAAGATSVSPGEITVTARVSVQYEM